MVEWDVIVNQFAHSDEKRALLKFYAQWMPASTITDADILQYPFLGVVKSAKREFFRATVEERMDSIEKRFKDRKTTMEECVNEKSKCLDFAQTMGVRL